MWCACIVKSRDFELKKQKSSIKSCWPEIVKQNMFWQNDAIETSRSWFQNSMCREYRLLRISSKSTKNERMAVLLHP